MTANDWITYVISVTDPCVTLYRLFANCIPPKMKNNMNHQSHEFLFFNNVFNPSFMGTCLRLQSRSEVQNCVTIYACNKRNVQGVFSQTSTVW